MRLIYFFVLLANLSFSQTKTKVYFFPGQGSDERVFSKIVLDTNYEKHFINYPIPSKGCTMKEFAVVISKEIDTNSKFVLVGVSLGGMLCTELADIMHPQKTIIISSAKCTCELPMRYKFQKHFPLNKCVPKRMIKMGARILQPLVEPDRNKNKEVFKSMLKKKDALYMKRTVNMIINWDRKNYSPTIIHLHGTNDHTLPIRNIKPTRIIKDGSHMMVLTRGDEINAQIMDCLKQ